MGAGGRLEGYYLGYQDSPPIGFALCAVDLKLSPSCLTGCNQSLELYSKHLNLSRQASSDGTKISRSVQQALSYLRQASPDGIKVSRSV